MQDARMLLPRGAWRRVLLRAGHHDGHWRATGCPPSSTSRSPRKRAARRPWTTPSWRTASAIASTTPYASAVRTRAISRGSGKPARRPPAATMSRSGTQADPEQRQSSDAEAEEDEEGAGVEVPAGRREGAVPPRPPDALRSHLDERASAQGREARRLHPSHPARLGPARRGRRPRQTETVEEIEIA